MSAEGLHELVCQTREPREAEDSLDYEDLGHLTSLGFETRSGHQRRWDVLATPPSSIHGRHPPHPPKCDLCTKQSKYPGT